MIGGIHKQPAGTAVHSVTSHSFAGRCGGRSHSDMLQMVLDDYRVTMVFKSKSTQYFSHRCVYTLDFFLDGRSGLDAAPFSALSNSLVASNNWYPQLPSEWLVSQPPRGRLHGRVIGHSDEAAPVCSRARVFVFAFVCGMLTGKCLLASACPRLVCRGVSTRALI